MPEYVYRAVTDKGQIVRNRVEEASKQALIKKLKKNDLMPIDVRQASYAAKKQKKARRNSIDIDEIMKTASTSNLLNKNMKKEISFSEKMNATLSGTEKITSRDLVIFTQNFYLLKKDKFSVLSIIVFRA